MRTLVRPDELLRTDLLGLIERYTGDLDGRDVTVSEGVATVQRTHGTPEVSVETEEGALRTLASTVRGIAGARAPRRSIGERARLRDEQRAQQASETVTRCSPSWG